MKKIIFIACVTAISLKGGAWMAVNIFGETGPSEMALACAMLIAFAFGAMSAILNARKNERSAIRIADYCKRRDERFAEIDENNYMLRYKAYSEDLERR